MPTLLNDLLARASELSGGDKAALTSAAQAVAQARQGHWAGFAQSAWLGDALAQAEVSRTRARRRGSWPKRDSCDERRHGDGAPRRREATTPWRDASHCRAAAATTTSAFSPRGSPAYVPGSQAKRSAHVGELQRSVAATAASAHVYALRRSTVRADVARQLLAETLGRRDGTSRAYLAVAHARRPRGRQRRWRPYRRRVGERTIGGTRSRRRSVDAPRTRDPGRWPAASHRAAWADARRRGRRRIGPAPLRLRS